MAYLHENREEFENAVSLTFEKYGILREVAEKDYYVTMILRLLSKKLPFIVFKGGTSLSKCHKVINRFSEDIDVTIDIKLSQGQMGKVKEAIKEAAEELGLQIPNIDETRSRRSYNKYILQYDTVLEKTDPAVTSAVILETSFAEVSFPTVILPIDSYIGRLMQEEAPEEIENFALNPFDMKVQGIERTMIDKVFAICDYYMKGDIRRHSRHIYDIYKMMPIVPLDGSFVELVHEVRAVRAKNVNLCLSAQPGVDVPKMLTTIVEGEVYKLDYETVTSRILDEQVSYETAIKAISSIAKSGVFAE